MKSLSLTFLGILFQINFGHGFLFDELIQVSSSNPTLAQDLPQTGSDLESMLFRSCYVCHGTSISSVTSSCWETVDESHRRFVSVKSCFGACSITVSNHSRVGLIDYTRHCDPDCVAKCHQPDEDTQMCKYCCYGDRCNNVLPTYTVERPENSGNASETNLRKWLGGVMSKPRHHSIYPSNKIASRKHIITTWRSFGIHPFMQEFTIAKTVLEDKSPHNYRSYIKLVIKGYNIIATVRGRHYGTIHDRIVVLMAHYDTHIRGSPGVDDNASGISALLEIARLLTRNVTCPRDHSVMLVATDFSEEGSYWEGVRNQNYTNCVFGDQYQGLSGASHFLCGYLLPHLQRTGAHIMAAFNLHSILNYESGPASQSLPEVQDFITGKFRYNNAYYRQFEHDVIKRRYVGDWAMVSYVQVVADAKTTRFYVNALAKQWKRLEREEFNTALIKQHFPLDGEEHKIMQQDDCLPFARLRHPLPCISVTDTGPLRGYMKRCHHQKCDDIDHVNDDKIRFLAMITNAMWKTAEKFTRSSCSQMSPTNDDQVTGTPRNEISRLPIHKTCKTPLLKTATTQRNSALYVTATCRSTRTALHLCVTPRSGVWGMLNSRIAWIPKKAKKRRSRRLWFQIDFGSRRNVTATSVQGVPSKGYLRSFRLAHSNDGSTWIWYMPVNSASTDDANLVGPRRAKRTKKIFLNPIITSRYVRIHPLKWKGRIALRAEFYGC